MGIWTGGDSWQSEPWRHRGDNLPINRMHGSGICYRAISMPSVRAQRDRRFKTSHPPASPIPGDELQLRAGGTTPSGASPAGFKFLYPLLYPGKVLSKTTGISSAVLLGGGQTQPRAAAQRAPPRPLGALLNHQTTCKPWGRKRQDIHMQSIKTDHPTKTVQTLFQRRAQQSPSPPGPRS